MRHAFAVLIVLAAPAMAQDGEDGAHSADRLRTQELNRRAPSGYSTAIDSQDSDHTREDYARAQADYRDRLAAWRRRVAACEGGYYDACQH